MNRYLLRGDNPRFYEKVMDGIRRLSANREPMLGAFFLQLELIRVRIQPTQILQKAAVELGSLFGDHHPKGCLVFFSDSFEFNG